MSIYQHSIGVTLDLTIPSTVSLVNLVVRGELRKPDGSMLVVTPTRSSYTFSYSTQAGDLNLPGRYTYCLRLSYSNSSAMDVTDPLVFYVWKAGVEAV